MAPRWRSSPNGAWRAKLTKDESTFGTGQKTDLPTEPAISRSTHQLAFAVGDPYCLFPGFAASRYATSLCTITTPRLIDGNLSKRLSSTGTEML